MYTTLTGARKYMHMDSTSDDEEILRLIRRASTLIDQQQGRYFEPWVKTLDHDTPVGDELVLLEDLLELTSVVNGDGDMIPSSALVLRYEGKYPKKRIRLIPGHDVVWEITAADSEAIQAIPVAGIWGWHDSYLTNAWEDSEDTVQSELSINGTALSVSSGSGLSEWYESPRFQEGQLLRLGSGSQIEFVRCRAKPSVIELTIQRAINGSTAYVWPAGTKIYIWHPVSQVEEACLEEVRVLYHQASTNIAGVQQILGTGVKITPEGLADHVVGMLPSPKVLL